LVAVQERPGKELHDEQRLEQRAGGIGAELVSLSVEQKMQCRMRRSGTVPCEKSELKKEISIDD